MQPAVNPWAPDPPPNWWRPDKPWCPQPIKTDGYYSSGVCRTVPRTDSELCGPHYYRLHPPPARLEPKPWTLLAVSVVVNQLQHIWLAAQEWLSLTNTTNPESGVDDWPF